MRKSILDKQDAVRLSVDDASRFYRTLTGEKILCKHYCDDRTYESAKNAIFDQSRPTDTNYSTCIVIGLTESMRSL